MFSGIIGVLIGKNNWIPLSLEKETEFCQKKWAYILKNSTGKMDEEGKKPKSVIIIQKKAMIKKNTRKFTLMLAIIKEILDNMNNGITILKREMFYRYIDLAESQTDFDNLIQEFSYRLRVPRHQIFFVV